MMATTALIALCLGYLTYVTASKEKEGVKLIGQAIGIAVMILAVLAMACGACRAYKSKAYCPTGSGSYAVQKYCPTQGPAGS